jgi:uncharacterized membrane protein|tara:strand:- start:2723 stop:3091 length:369 start_codon:yes stop_codon:yes gene_type:complete
MFNLIKAIIALSILDFIYLKSTGTIFSNLIYKIQKNKLNLRMYSALCVYILIFIMWYVFIYKQKDNFTFKENLLRAFILGFTTYGIYDFTNHAILKDWNMNIVIMDTLWGGILYTIITLVSI